MSLEQQLAQANSERDEALKVKQEALEFGAQMEAERDHLAEQLNETYTDERGTVWTRPTAWAYAKACEALHKKEAQLELARMALEFYADSTIYPPALHALAHFEALRDGGYRARKALAQLAQKVEGEK